MSEPKNVDLICKDCAKPFYVTPKDQSFFLSQGWPLPCRCYACRLKRKQLKKESE